MNISFQSRLNDFAERLRLRLFLWISLIVLVPRLIFVAVAPERSVYGNAPGELAVAKNLVEGRGYSDGGSQPDSDFNPGYICFLAACRLLSGDSLLLIKSAHIAFDIGTALLLSYMLVSYCSPLAAIVFSIAFALHPLFLRLNNNINDEPMLMFFVTLSFVALYWALEQPSTRSFLRAGLCVGAAILTKGTALFLPYFLAATLWLVVRRPNAPRLWQWLVYLVAAALLMLPWSYRNYKVLGHFSFNVHGIGQNLWYGSDPQIFTHYGSDMRAHAAKLENEMIARGFPPPSNHNVFDREQWMLRLAIQKYEDLLHNPLFLAKTLFLKGARTLYASEDHPSGHLPMILLQIPTVWLATIGLLRLWRQEATRTLAWLLASYIVYYYAVVSVGLPLVRYFIPAIPFLLAAAAVGLISVISPRATS